MMGTFAIIFLVLCFVAGMMSRNKPTIEITDKNKHILINPEYSEYSELNKEELKSLIINEAGDKNNAYRNSEKIVVLCKSYFKRFGYELTILETIITCLCADKKFDEAHKFGSLMVSKGISMEWGFFFKAEVMWYKGSIYEGSRFFSLSSDNGMDNNYINKRKQELLPFLKPIDRRDKAQLEIEKKGEGRFILN